MRLASVVTYQEPVLQGTSADLTSSCRKPFEPLLLSKQATPQTVDRNAACDVNVSTADADVSVFVLS